VDRGRNFRTIPRSDDAIALSRFLWLTRLRRSSFLAMTESISRRGGARRPGKRGLAFVLTIFALAGCIIFKIFESRCRQIAGGLLLC
jgi:hypothetical protein